MRAAGFDVTFKVPDDGVAIMLSAKISADSARELALDLAGTKETNFHFESALHAFLKDSNKRAAAYIFSFMDNYSAKLTRNRAATR